MSAEYKTYEVRVFLNGDKKWRNNGKLHREDGPAVELIDGTKEWLINGKRHREDGPAIERANGDKFWFINGKYHREDGPAIEYAGGTKFWFINGKQLTEEEFNNRNKPCEEKTIEIDGKKYKNLVTA